MLRLFGVDQPRRAALALIGLLAFAAAACQPIQPVTDKVENARAEKSTGVAEKELIPREVLFGNPDKASVRLSPDGKHISWLAPVDGVLNIWVAPTEDVSAAKPVTNDTGRGIQIYAWLYSPDHLIYLQDVEGDENWRIYSINLASGETTDLTPLENVQARIQGVSQKQPNRIVVGLNDRIPQLHDLHIVDLDSGERELLIENHEGFARYILDDEYRVRLGTKFSPDGGSEVLRYADDGTWEPFIQIAMEDSLTTTPLGFDKTNERLYMYDSRGRDTSALVLLDLGSGEETVIFEDPKADVSAIMAHPTEKDIQAVASTFLRKEWKVLDDDIAADLEKLATVDSGDVEISGRTLDDSVWVVAYLKDDGPVKFYLYDRGSGDADYLFSHREDLEGLNLAAMNPVVIPARDGLEIVSYYSLPASADEDGDGFPEAPLPMVLLVHGGPWFRDNWGYHPVHQMLANRGYAVMSVNFRGSTGFGKYFTNAGNLEWGAKMQDDLMDAVAWAVDNGIADPQRVAVMGGSYGGYATLTALTRDPEAFACGVDIVGPSNLVTLMESFPTYWEPQVNLFATRIGDHRAEEGRAFLLERSPLTHADNIVRPLLIGQGANDPRVKQVESDQIVEAVASKGVPVTYVLYPDEGHGFARPENNLSFFAIADAFLAECLDGVSEPIGDDFNGSSLTVPFGAEEIVGLEDALETE